jgi:gliding motility-associated-like protein
LRRALFILTFVVLCRTLGAQAHGVLPFGYLQGYDFSTEPMTKVKTKMRAAQAYDGSYSRFSNCVWNCDGSLKYFSSIAYVFNGNSGDTIKGGFYYDMKGAFGYNAEGSNFNQYLIPKPGSNDSIYLFYTFGQSKNTPWKLAYAIIDNRGDGGKGEIVKKGIVLQNKHKNLHYTRHANGKWWWLVTAWNEDSAAAYLITDSGISHNPIFSKCISNILKLNVFSTITEGYGGAFRFSHNGKYLLSTGIDENVNPLGNVLLYEFDNTNGKLSNPKVLLKMAQFPNPDMQTYTAEFSPNDSFIFVSSLTETPLRRPPYLFQINIFSKQVYRHIIGPSTEYASGAARTLITAPNNSLLGNFGLNNYAFLNIKYPNKWGAAVKIVKWNDSNGADIEQFPEPIYTYKNAIWESNLTYNGCGDSASFTYTGDTSFAWLKWQFGDGDSIVFYPPLKTKFTFWHKYKTEGKYYVRMQARHYTCNGNNWFGDSLEFKFNPSLVFNTPPQYQPYCDSAILQWKDSLYNTRSWYLRSINGATNDSANWNSSSGTLTSLFAKSRFERDTSAARLQLILQAPNGCTKQYIDTVGVQLLPKPIASIICDSLLCEGAAFVAEDTAARETDTLYWTYAGVTKTTIGQIDNKYIALKIHDSLTLLVVAKNGCKSEVHKQLQIAPRPFAYFSVSDSLCQGDTLIANATAPVLGAQAFWDWDKTITGPLTIQNSQFKTQVTLTGTLPLGLVLRSTDGCADTQVASVHIFSTPNAQFALNSPVCNNISFKVNGARNVSDQQSKWYVNNMLYGTDSIAVFQNLKAGNQVISHAVNTVYGCADSASQTIQILPSPAAQIASSDTGFCKNQPFSIAQRQDTGSSSWYFQSTTQNNDTFAIAVTTNTNVGKWPLILVRRYNNGCTDTASIDVTIYQNPMADISYTAPICQFDTVLLASVGAGSTYKWTLEQNNYYTKEVAYVFTKAGENQVQYEIESAEGCIEKSEEKIWVHSVPKLAIYSQGSAYNADLGYGWYFNTIPDTFTEYKWDLGAAGVSKEVTPRVYYKLPEDTQQITVRVVTNSGCAVVADTAIIIKGLTLYLFPSAFTPNANALNDGFGIAGPEYIKQYKLWVFNRWGENVFYTEDPNSKWTGDQNQSGLYVYKAKVQDIYSRWTEVEGTVMLLR